MCAKPSLKGAFCESLKIRFLKWQCTGLMYWNQSEKGDLSCLIKTLPHLWHG